jgi:hypothetical protein
MWSRFIIVAITFFFITMNVLLWRSEIAGRRTLKVPPKVVLKRILENEHKANFEIRHDGVKIGYCRWVSTIQTEPAEFLSIEGAAVEGMAQEQSGYTIDFEGGVSLGEAIRLRFDSELKLKSEQQWERFTLDLKVKPESWHILASAAAQEVQFGIQDDRGRTDRTFKFSDFRNPDKVLRELAGPLVPELLSAIGFSFSPEPLAGTSAGLAWEAWTDSLTVRNIQIPVYRLQGRFLDRAQIVVLVQRDGGEIMRVELPNNVVLLNDVLTQF